MQIRQVGSYTGDVWLFGGAYSNAEATRAFLARASAAGAPMIGTGDMVGYCADPRPVLEMLDAAGAALIAGNVERQLGAGAADCGCGFAPGSACERLAASWYPYAEAQLPARWRDRLMALPDMAVFAHEGRRYAVVHGGLTDIALFLWPCSPEEAFRQEITAIAAAAGPVDGVIAGHCGLAFERVIDGVHWINAGAIGLPPHDARPMTRYAVLGADGVRFHRLAYDHGGAAARMRAAGLAGGYAEALTGGIWPSEDILPAELRR